MLALQNQIIYHYGFLSRNLATITNITAVLKAGDDLKGNHPNLDIELDIHAEKRIEAEDGNKSREPHSYAYYEIIEDNEIKIVVDINIDPDSSAKSLVKTLQNKGLSEQIEQQSKFATDYVRISGLARELLANDGEIRELYKRHEELLLGKNGVTADTNVGLIGDRLDSSFVINGSEHYGTSNNVSFSKSSRTGLINIGFNPAGIKIKATLSKVLKKALTIANKYL